MCKKCAKPFEADDEYATLCTPCWKDFVRAMHDDSISVEDKINIQTEYCR